MSFVFSDMVLDNRYGVFDTILSTAGKSQIMPAPELHRRNGSAFVYRLAGGYSDDVRRVTGVLWLCSSIITPALTQIIKHSTSVQKKTGDASLVQSRLQKHESTSGDMMRVSHSPRSLAVGQIVILYSMLTI